MRMIDDCRYHLVQAGISMPDADALRRISMTLHRWHELECGTSNDHISYSLVRGYKGNGKASGSDDWFTYDDNGKPFMETHYHRGDAKAKYYQCPDREKGALKRLGKIMARYPQFQAYVQGDPRGAALYILRPGDIPEGADVSSCYSRGLAVFK